MFSKNFFEDLGNVNYYVSLFSVDKTVKHISNIWKNMHQKLCGK